MARHNHAPKVRIASATRVTWASVMSGNMGRLSWRWAIPSLQEALQGYDVDLVLLSAGDPSLASLARLQPYPTCSIQLSMDERAKTPIVLDYASQPTQRGPSMRWMLVFGVTTLTLILAALGSNLLVPRLGPRTSAKMPAAKMMVGPDGSIVRAIESFQSQLGTYPTILADLCEPPPAIDPENDRWYQFLSDCRLIDPWGNRLVYYRTGEGSEGYELLSCGPDGKPGTDDDVANWCR